MIKDTSLLKKISTITTILNSFAEQFDCNVKYGLDFSYYSAKNLITYSLLVTEKANETFNSFVHKDFPNINADIFLWSFLHEIGHNMTEDDFEEEEWEEYMNRLENWNGTDDEYYHLPIEYAATHWAYNYMMNHTKEVKELWDKIHSIIETL